MAPSRKGGGVRSSDDKDSNGADSWLFDGKVSDSERLAAVENTLGTAMVKLDAILERLDKITVVAGGGGSASPSSALGQNVVSAAAAVRRASLGAGEKMSSEARAKTLAEAPHDKTMDDLLSPDLNSEGGDEGNDVVVAPVLVEKDDWMINPKNRFRLTWDLVVIMPLLFYLTCVMPFRLCFGNEAEQFSPIYWFEFMIDMVFIVDIIFNFRTGVFVGSDGGEPGDEMDLVEYDRWRVFQTYLHSWLVLDVVSGIPFALLDLVFGATGNAGVLKSAKSLRLLRFLKLGRLLKMEKILSNLDRDTQDKIEDFLQAGGTRSVIVMVKLMLVLAYACHILACGFVLVGRTCAMHGVEENWLSADALGPWYPEDTTVGESVWHIYVAAFYFTITTLTSVGYGDILARNNTERVFVICVEFMGAIMFAMIIAQITSVVTSMDMNSKKTAEQLDEVSSFVEIRAFPVHLGRRIRRHFRHFYSLKAAIDETKIFSELSTSLRKEVSSYLVMNLMGAESFFSTMPPSLWPRLLPMLRPVRFEVDEVVCVQGEECTEMYVVLQGSLLGETRVRGEEKEGPRLRHITMGGHVNVLCALGIWSRCVETVSAEGSSGSTTMETYAVTASDFQNLFTAESDVAAFEQMQEDQAATFKMSHEGHFPTSFGRPLYLWCYSTVQICLIQARGLINKDRAKLAALQSKQSIKDGSGNVAFVSTGGAAGSVAEGSDAWLVCDLVDTDTGKSFNKQNWRYATRKHVLRALPKGGQPTPTNGGLEPFWGEVVRWMDISVPFDSAALRIRLFGTDRISNKEVVVGMVVLRLTDLERQGVASGDRAAASGLAPASDLSPEVAKARSRGSGFAPLAGRTPGDVERWYDLRPEDQLYTQVKLADGGLKRRLSLQDLEAGGGAGQNESSMELMKASSSGKRGNTAVHVRVMARRPEHAPVVKAPLHLHKRQRTPKQERPVADKDSGGSGGGGGGGGGGGNVGGGPGGGAEEDRSQDGPDSARSSAGQGTSPPQHMGQAAAPGQAAMKRPTGFREGDQREGAAVSGATSAEGSASGNGSTGRKAGTPGGTASGRSAPPSARPARPKDRNFVVDPVATALS